jgi:serine/threonine protein kinase
MKPHLTKKKKGSIPIKVDPSDFIKIKNVPIERDYELLEPLGQGSFGKVFKAVSKASGEIRAVKILDR